LIPWKPCSSTDAQLEWHWRSTTDREEEAGGTNFVLGEVRRFSTLRLTRRGNTILAEYSSDKGRSFRAVGPQFTFPDPLPKRMYVGLFWDDYSVGSASEAKFSGLRIINK
jgi:hypothetical protein